MNKNENTNIIKNLLPLEVINFSKKYSQKGKFAVEDATFNAKKGEFHGFIGANGAGKTTTIKSLVGAYAKFKGDVKIFGYKSTSLEAKKYIGYIPERASFPKELSCFQYVWRMANLSGFTKLEAQEISRDELEKLGLKAFMHKNPNKLSSGQKKKVLLAQALVHKPQLIIMDEPAANLDPKARTEFFGTLKKLSQSGVTIFISSHILAELELYVDSLTILDGGKVKFSGAIEELRNDDKLEYTIKFNNKLDFKKYQADIIKYLKSKKISHKIDGEGIIVSLKHENSFYLLLSFVAKNKIKISGIHKNTKSLQNIYDEFTSSKEVSND